MVESSNVFQRILLLLPLAYPYQGPAPKQQNTEWSYDNPQRWSSRYPLCAGSRQSPIHLRSATSYLVPLQPITFYNYDIPLPSNLTLSNTGHTVEFDVPATTNGQRPYITGGTLRNAYEAVGVHFHWGSNRNKGSEHVINNRRFDVEMHIVHKNIKYPTLEDALRNTDGVSVLGVMLKSTRSVDRIYPGLNKIFNELPAVVQYRSVSPIRGEISMTQLLGDINTKNFFTYSGSLTSPNCAEVVTWHVFPEPLPISYEHIRKFWSILNSQGGLLVNNFRPLQRRNARPVFYRGNLPNRI